MDLLDVHRFLDDSQMDCLSSYAQTSHGTLLFPKRRFSCVLAQICLPRSGTRGVDFFLAQMGYLDEEVSHCVERDCFGKGSLSSLKMGSPFLSQMDCLCLLRMDSPSFSEKDYPEQKDPWVYFKRRGYYFLETPSGRDFHTFSQHF